MRSSSHTALILVLFTWRYVSVTHEYIIAVGEIAFSHIYANRKRKEVLRLSIREIEGVFFDEMDVRGKKIEKTYDFRSEANTPDSYCILFLDEKERRCLVYFEATRKAIKLLQLYHPHAVKTGKSLRY